VKYGAWHRTSHSQPLRRPRPTFRGPGSARSDGGELVRKSGLRTLLKGPWAFPALGARGGSGASLLVLGVAALLVGLRPGNSVTPEPATGGTEARRPEETRKRGPEGSARPGGLRAPENDALAFGSRGDPCAGQALRLARRRAAAARGQVPRPTGTALAGRAALAAQRLTCSALYVRCPPARLTASGRAANENVAEPEQRRTHVFGARVRRRGEARARELRGEDVGRVAQVVFLAAAGAGMRA
jgi:hypothetical protein